MLNFNDKDIAKNKTDLENIIKASEETIKDILSIPNKSYENFMTLYQKANENINRLSNAIFHIDAVANSKETDKLSLEVIELLSNYQNKLTKNQKLNDAFISINKTNLTKTEKKVITNEIKSFKLSGAFLDKKKKTILDDINLQLDKLSHNFSSNIIKSIDKYELKLPNDDYLKELPKSDKILAKTKDGYLFTLLPPSFGAFMRYCSCSDLREELYRANMTKAEENSTIIDKILKLKSQKARLLGFDSYATFSLETKMANSPDEVVEFLLDLSNRSKAKAKEQFKELENFAIDIDGISKLNAWDIAYYSEKLKLHKLSINEELYRPYFEQNIVLNGLFEFLYDMFGIEFKKIDEKLWDEKAEKYDIYEKNKKIATIYFDLESRKNKRGGAWMNDYQSKTKDSLPIAFVVCNFPPSNKQTPSLLRHNDVVTLFHEVGHALHHLLSDIEEPFVSGVNGVAWDVVEFPSQFLENFCYDFETIKKFAINYKTKKQIPKKMIDELINAKNFHSSMAMARQIEFSLFDMLLHKKLYQKDEIQKLLDETREKVSVIIPPRYNKFQNSFDHIFGGGYSAGYYSYKWAEVLSADAFISYKKSVDKKEFMNRYRQTVLSLSGSEDMDRIYYKFLSKKPNPNSLLIQEGII